MVCESWLGTPFRHRAWVKGKGVDCLMFALNVMEELGAALPVRPWYPEDWFLHTDNSILIEMIEKREWLRPEWRVGRVEDDLCGDIWIMKVGRARAANHVAIYTPKGLYHAIWGRGVVFTPHEAWRKGVVARYRVWR